MLIQDKAIVPAKPFQRRKEKRWCVELRLGYDDTTGKTVKKSLYGRTRTEVNEKQTEYIQNKSFNAVSTETLDGCIFRWLNEVKAQKMKSTSYDRLEQTYVYQVKPYLSMLRHQKVDEIDCFDISNILKQTFNAGYSYSTLLKAYRLLKQFFTFYVQLTGCNHINPVNGVKMYSKDAVSEKQKELREMNAPSNKKLKRNDQTEHRYLTNEEIQRLKTACCERKSNGTYKIKQAPIFIFALNTGLRTGELLGLKVSDFDFNEQTVTIQRNVVSVCKRDAVTNRPIGRKIVIQSTKTHNSEQTLPLNQTAMTIIKELIDEQGAGFNGFILHGKNPDFPIEPRALEKRFYNILKIAGIEKCGMHTLRHTFASKLYEISDGNTKFVCDMLRHCDPQFTAKTYIHLTKQYEKKKFNNFSI